jgi:transposase
MFSLLTHRYIVNLFYLCLRLNFYISVGNGVSLEMEVRLKPRVRPNGVTRAIKEIRTMAKRFKRKPKPKTSNGNHSQNWKIYNLVQTMEKFLFPQILRILCGFVPEPVTSCPGRPKTKYADQVFCLVIKAFECDSGRRYTSDLHTASERKLLDRVPHFNSVLNYGRDEQLVEILQHLVVRSSFPLRKLEKIIAIDSTSFSTDQYVQWSKVKFGKSEEWHDWRKLHVAVGVDTHIITAVLTSDAYANDYNFLRALLRITAASGFEILEVCADKAYLGGENMRAVALLDATPYIMPKARTSSEGKSKVWKDMYELHENDPEEFGAHYHLRSNVETVFSMIKTVFDGSLRAKSKTGQRTELLAKALCHNIRVLIRCMYELNVELDFSDLPPIPEDEGGQGSLALDRINYIPGINRN